MPLDLKTGSTIPEANGSNLRSRFKLLNIPLWRKEGERRTIRNICGIALNSECSKTRKIY
ncbi:Uncharacterised protein [Vibrio cholerae]|nr:Uncharacterised protein [Vibrio cholerae]